ncbi:hypothetical protein, partial [Streptomyces sp. NPDC056670]|uniref:hypothetical protein n=1 Tax=Streptomyces sp. NPDC056670 TaxID=3345904 RepID=UPI0036B60FD9
TIEPHQEEWEGSASKGKFRLYDSDFKKETSPKYQALEGATLYRPHFPIGGIAPYFFGRDTTWLKNQLKRPPVLNGKPLEFRQVQRSSRLTERRLTLPDIERLGFALQLRGSISAIDLQRCIQALIAVAHLHDALVDKNGNKIT